MKSKLRMLIQIKLCSIFLPSCTLTPHPSHSTISLISSLLSPKQPQQINILFNLSSRGPPFCACCLACSITSPTVKLGFSFLPSSGSSKESSDSSDASSSSFVHTHEFYISRLRSSRPSSLLRSGSFYCTLPFPMSLESSESSSDSSQ